jgi:hypothetical protein
MGPAATCPSARLGFCKIKDKCYAKKSEFMYPSVLPYRIRQHKYWSKTSIENIKNDFEKILKRIKINIKYLRFNEASDFFSQNDVKKLDKVSEFLKENYQITTYGYTARKDLNFTGLNFLVKGSSCNVGNNGKTIVLEKKKIPDFLKTLTKEEIKQWKVCPMSCKSCDLCKEYNKYNIVFPLH